MDKYNLILNMIVFLCAGTAFVYGVMKFFKRKVALFNQLIVCGIGCMMLGRLFNVVAVLTNGFIVEGFSVGMLGFVGGFMFLFSASYGQMDGLVDDRTSSFRKYRLIGLIAPVVIMLSYIPVFISKDNVEEKVISAIIFISLAMCSYYNLKHFVIQDVDMGIIQSIREYNLLALLMALFSAGEVVAESFGTKTFTAIVAGCLCIVYLVVIPALDKGVKRWTM